MLRKIISTALPLNSKGKANAIGVSVIGRDHIEEEVELEIVITDNNHLSLQSYWSIQSYFIVADY